MTIEDFFLKEQLTEIKKKHIDVILKLNCYMDISIDGEKNPAPERIRDIMMERYVYIMIGDSMIPFGVCPVKAVLGPDLLCIFDSEEQIRNMKPDQSKLADLPGRGQDVTAKGKDSDCVSRSFFPKLLVAEATFAAVQE